MINYLNRTEDFYSYLEGTDVFPKDFNKTQAQKILEVASFKKSNNKVLTSIFGDKLKIKKRINYSFPYSKMENSENKEDVQRYSNYMASIKELTQMICGKVQRNKKDMLEYIKNLPETSITFEGFSFYIKDTFQVRLIAFFIHNNYDRYIERALKEGEEYIRFNRRREKKYYPYILSEDEIKDLYTAYVEKVKEGISKEKTSENIYCTRHYWASMRVASIKIETLDDIFNKFLQKNGKVIPDRLKPYKFTKKLLDALNSDKRAYDLLEKIQIDYSMLKQACVTEGDLTLSIDPIDFLSASDNTNHWRSCFAVINCGEYNRGSYSALLSENTCIAYFESKTPYVFADGRTCSNKTWRAWVHLDNNAIVVNKGYPYQNENISNFIYSWIFSLTPQVWVSNTEANVTLEVTDEYMYNDLSNPFFYINNDIIDSLDVNNIDNSKIYYTPLGSPIYDPYSDTFMELLYDENALFWADVSNYDGGFCEDCGEYVHDIDDLRETEEGDVLCSSCYETYLEWKRESEDEEDDERGDDE